jgi:lipoate-protein ligase A
VTGTAWTIARPRGAAGELHALEPPDAGGRVVWCMDLTEAGLVLGSTQRPSLAATALPVAVRRSGGGAVLLEPDACVWVDVIVPRDDALWDDDVNRSFFWLGETWARALASLGIEGEVHRGGLDRTAWSRLVCFAGIGPGEVRVGGRKVVGLSQRRTRHGARFQCVLYAAPSAIATIVDLLAEPDGDEREALRAHLDATTHAVAAPRDQVIAAFLAALP